MHERKVSPDSGQPRVDGFFPPIRVLITESRRLMQDAYRSLIENAADSFMVVGYTGRMDTALNLAERLQPNVILLDINLAKPNLSQTVRNLRDKAPQASTLLVATSEWARDITTLVNQGERGKVGFVLTESTGVELLLGIREVYEHGSYFAAGVTRLLFAQDNQGQGPKIRVQQVLRRRELEVLKEISDGKPNREIARELGISVRTVEAHKARMISRLGLSHTTELLRYAMNTTQNSA